QELWRKGDTSGSLQHVVEARTDCDQDAVLLKVRVDGSGASCHVGYRSCFYRTIPVGSPPSPETELGFAEAAPVFDPDEVYGKKPGK
ncbi:MAG: phosphoribosyl-AMP cyclohydrolase, partial [Hyphomicrobiales bacterium]|nr:phosphoribosyl-AMP cyclohydrolase [Hyphomicrobiales bacterium]